MKNNQKKGFTLIELLIVVAIIGILAAVGVAVIPGLTSGAKGGLDYVNDVSKNAVVGQLYGLNVIVNAYVPSTRYGVFDMSMKPVAYVERRGLTVEEANPGFGILGSYLSLRYGLKIIRPESGLIVFD